MKKIIMQNISKKRRIEVVFAFAFRFLLAVSMAVSFFNQDWLNLFIAVVTMILTFLPFIIARRNHISLPPSFQIIILAFLFGTQYLGELNEYYIKFWWWDLLAHTLSGVILGFIGFLLVYILNKEEKVDVMLSPFFMALFAFTFALAVGALWEIFEFAMDCFFGLNMQKSGLVDTMWDLIVDAVGAIASCCYGYIYEKRKQEGTFSFMLNNFISSNKKLFKKSNSKKSKENQNLKI